MTSRIEERLLSGGRLTAEDGAELMALDQVLALSERADETRRRLHPGNEVPFRLAREVWLSTPDGPCSGAELDREREEARARGVDEVRFLAGPHPPTLGRLADRFEETRDRFGLRVGAFPASQLPGPPGSLKMLRDCGLSGLLISGEAGSDEAVVSASQFGLPLIGTLTWRPGLGAVAWLQGLARLRAQSEQLAPFAAFLPRVQGNGGGRGYSGFDFLRVVAVARLFFDRIPVIRIAWTDLEQKMASVALRYGADEVDAFDPGPGPYGFQATPRAELLRQVQEEGFVPVADPARAGDGSLLEGTPHR